MPPAACPCGAIRFFSNTIRSYRGSTGFSQTDQAVPVSYWGGNPGGFIATVFTLTSRSTEILKRLKEERLDIMRLKPSGFRALHFFAHAMDAAGIHRLRRKSSVFEKRAKFLVIEGSFNGLC